MGTPMRAIHRSRRTAFSLIELLLVLVILAVLAAVVVPKFTNRTEQARITAAKTDISMYSTALDAFEIDNGRFPSGDEGLDALARNPGNLTTWKNPYVGQVKNDPWGRPYVYRYPGTNNPASYDLYSVGPDGREGNDDIDNWTKQ
jgi:general secretion pathway protein G